MKTEFILTLFDDEKTKKKLEIMNCLEAMFDDERNGLPREYFFFSDEIPLGSRIRVTIELVPNVEVRGCALAQSQRSEAERT